MKWLIREMIRLLEEYDEGGDENKEMVYPVEIEVLRLCD